MTSIEAVDLRAAYARHKPGIDAAVQDVVANGRFIQGREVAAFERAFADFCGVPDMVGVASGTAAIHLVLAALGIGAGDEVAIPSHTFVGTAEPLGWLGARPRFIDIDPDTGGMSAHALKEHINGVRAVLPVHIHGRPVDLDAIGAITAEAGVPLIEDAAQAHGAQYRSTDGSSIRAGGYGVAGCFSFYPGKNLGAFGDAGGVTTGDEELAARIRLLRDHGSLRKHEHLRIGYAARMDTIHAAVLMVKLSSLDADNARRRALADRYSAALSGVGDLRLPPDTSREVTVVHHYVLRTEYRDRLLSHLLSRGIGAAVHYPVPVHLQPAYAHLGYRRGCLPVTERYARHCLSLPMYPELTDDQLGIVVDAVARFFDTV